MYKYHFKIIWRNLARFKLHLIINIAGFSIGISSFILILLYVQSELSIDSFHKNRDRIYKVTLGGSFNTMAPFAVMLKDKIPEVEKITRIDFQMGGGKSPLLKVKEGVGTKTLQVNDIIYADSTFFDIFSFKVLNGNAKEALTKPNSIVLTKSVSHRLFGNENPVGNTIEFIGTNENPRLVYTVTAIIEDNPGNSSLRFNAITSFNTLKSIKPAGVDVDDDYANWTYETYILTNMPYNTDELNSKINGIWLEKILEKNGIQPESESSKEYVSGLVPLKDVSFYQNNRIEFIYLILLVGIIIIIISIINFVNLSIAKASLRSKEIEVRKVTGSSRYELVKMFIMESVIVTFIASSLAMLIVIFLIPLFNESIGKSIAFTSPQILKGIVAFFSGTVLIGILAGLYPAVYLSSFKPSAIYKSVKNNGRGTSSVIKSLIVFQFAISIILITGTITVSRQINFMRTGDVGFNKENIITFQLSKNTRGKFDVFKQQLLRNPEIINVGASSGSWLSHQFHMSFTGEINGSEKTYFAMAVDPDFVNTVGLKIISGRNFSNDLETDKYKAVILNETAVKNFGLQEPLGFEIEMANVKARVVGVVKDFHNESFQKKINSLVLWNVPDYSSNLSIRISGNNTAETIGFIKKQWEEFSPDIPFQYNFLDAGYDALYKEEVKFNRVITYFSVIAILIACMGLLGVVSLSIATRTKEIGIRKINGARISEILFLLNRSFILLVVIAYLVAVPIAWYVMSKWLGNFAFRTGLSWWIFTLAGLLAITVAVITISWQSWRAATRNPVEALRYE